MEKEWYKDWFSSDEYNFVYSHRNYDDAKQIIDLIISTLGLKKTDYLLDAPCGTGRHLNYLISLGYNVVGFDLSLPFLIKAKKIVLDNGFTPLLFRGDIRNFCLKRKFDCILNLFTSFGYFFSDDENFQFPINSLNLLNKGGYFVLDYINKEFLINNLVPNSVKEYNGITVIEKREIKDDRVIKTINLIKGNESKTYYESVKLYSKDIILERFMRIGYSLEYIFGDYKGNKFNEKHSERLIMIFRKC